MTVVQEKELHMQGEEHGLQQRADHVTCFHSQGLSGR